MPEKSLGKKIQRALDILEIQNVMGKHEYYHAAGRHKEEMEDIWAHKTPGVSFETDQQGKIEGWEQVWKYYGEGVELNAKRSLEEMIKLFPQIENDPKNYHIGTTVMHTLTTPVIEVAEDGKTGKGVWVSPGHITGVRGGKLQASWFWERYGVDFVKEDGKWKIWHLRVYTDFATPCEKSWVESSLEPRAAPATEPVTGLQAGKKRANPYKAYSPFTVPQFEPRPPEPYKTFDQTFSY
jgi:hypothetical protein